MSSSPPTDGATVDGVLSSFRFWLVMMAMARWHGKDCSGLGEIPGAREWPLFLFEALRNGGAAQRAVMP